MTKLAVEGGTPIRTNLLSYGKQLIDEEDISAVVDTLKSEWLTTGPRVQELELAVANYLNVPEAIALSSGTAALHAMMAAIDIGPGDEVIVPAMTFAATANAVVYQGGTPIFADVHLDTLLINENCIEKLITSKTKAIIAVDYAGQPCNYTCLQEIAEVHKVILLEDACHALGARYGEKKVGSISSLTAFSFHPVKHITTGEGGIVAVMDLKLATKIRRFRNHGISTDYRQREQMGTWFYEMVELGYNYRITDIQCALGISQLRKADEWLNKRIKIANRYDKAFAKLNGVMPLSKTSAHLHAYHLYVLRLDESVLRVDRGRIFSALRAEGIGVNVHYLPVHLHAFYKINYLTKEGLCPMAEKAYQSIISIPIFPSMTDGDVEDVIEAICKVIEAYRK